MNATRANFAATTLLCGTRVAVTGGCSLKGTTLTEAEVYDALTDTWSPVPELCMPRDNVCGCVVQTGELRGCFVVIGGRHLSANGTIPAGLPNSMFGKTCEYLARDESRWLELPSLNVSRFGASCVYTTESRRVTGDASNDGRVQALPVLRTENDGIELGVALADSILNGKDVIDDRPVVLVDGGGSYTCNAHESRTGMAVPWFSGGVKGAIKVDSTRAVRGLDM